MDDIVEKIDGFDKNVSKLRFQYELAKKRYDSIENEIKSKLEYKEILNKVGVLLKKSSEFARNEAKTQLENMVTNFLVYVFEENIRFEIELSESRDNVSADFYVVNEYEGYTVKTRPENSRGGGVVDIISIALRIAFMFLTKPPIEGPIIFDEPGKHVSNDYNFNLGEFLKKSSEAMNRQIIMVTHNQYLAHIGDNAFTVSIKNGKSLVEKASL